MRAGLWPFADLWCHRIKDYARSLHNPPRASANFVHSARAAGLAQIHPGASRSS